jgi:hypothetical protein
MITMTGRRLIAECDVFPDDVDPLTYYLMPKAPRIAVDDNGVPMFHLVWYRRPVDRLTEEERRTRLGGGILTVSTDLTPTQDEEAQIRKELAADPVLRQRVGPQLAADPVALAGALKVSAVPVKDGTVKIQVMGESAEAAPGTNEMVANLVGVGRVSATGVGRSSFMAKLTQDGAALLWGMVEKNLQLIRVEYDIVVEHRLDGVTMVVHCDVKKTFEATHEVWQDLKDDASWSEQHSGNSSHYSFSRDESNTGGNALRKIATDAQTVSVTVIPEAGPDVITPELIAELTKQGNDMVTDFLAGSFLEVDTEFAEQQEPTLKTQLADNQGRAYGHHDIHYYKLKSAHAEVQAELNYTLKTKAVVQAHLTPNDNLSNVTGGMNVEKFRTMLDLDADFYKFIAVEILCTADFDTEPVDVVRGSLRYKQGTIDAAEDVLFTKDDRVPKSFATYLAGPGAREYEYDFEIFYRGSSQTLRRTGRSSSDVLVLDTDTLGILHVDLQVGVVDFARIASVLVELWQGDGAARKEAEFTLTSAKQSATWVEVTPSGGAEPYHYRCTFIDTQGQRIEQPEQTSTSRTLVIEQPISQSLEVAVIPAGSFGAEGLISRVVVALRYIDEGNDHYTVDDILTLTSDVDSKIWTVPLVDTALRTYEYRVTVFYSDGVTREDTWQPTDRTILPVGDPFGMRVQILPYRLKVSGLYEFATIHLSFTDPQARITAEKDLQITDFAQPLFWRFRLGAPERHTYRYQLTLFTKDGNQVDLPETEASREVLTLAPPAVV